MNGLTVICDLSGSMAECGKRFIMRNALRAIRQYYQLLGVELSYELALWKSEVTTIPWRDEEDVPDAIFDCSGLSSETALINGVSLDADKAVIILTDGFWSHATQESIANWLDSEKAIPYRIIKIGTDANETLEGANVFYIEELLSALDELGD